MEESSNSKKAIKAGVGYTIGNILVKGISFVSLPIFARLLSVSDYGIVNTYNAYTSILFVIIGFALHSSIKNAKADFGERLESYCSSVTLLTIYNTIFLIIIASLFADSLANTMHLPVNVLPILIVVSSFGMTLVTFYNGVLSANYRYKEYLWLSFVYAIIGISASVLLIVTSFSEKRYFGRIVGMLIADVLISIYILIKLFKTAKPKNNTQFWKYGLRISLPIVPHGLSQIVLSQFDRLMINKMIGSVEAGIYSFAYNIGIIFYVVASSLDNAWSQWFFDEMKIGEEKTIRKVANVYCLVMAIGAVAIMLISPELILVIGGKKYGASRMIAPTIVLAMFYSYMYYFPASIEYYYKKTSLIAIGTTCAALLNVFLNIICIKRYGYLAAAYTTVFCYLAYYIFHVFISKKILGYYLYDMQIQLTIMAFVTLSMFLCIVLIDRNIIRIIIFVILFIISVVFISKKREVIISIWKNLG